MPTALPFDAEFDVIFSNACLHWIYDHRPVLHGIRRALKRGGRVLLQMGGKGNAAAIMAAHGRTDDQPAMGPLSSATSLSATASIHPRTTATGSSKPASNPSAWS